MGDANPAEVLPEVYRMVLDRVASLERAGDRRAAYALRSRATRVYSSRWNARALRSLQKITREADQRLDGMAPDRARDLRPELA